MTSKQFTQPEEREKVTSFAVVCLLCGVKMRDSKTEDSFGQCWKCFYRILNEHLRAQRRTADCLFASER